MGAGEGNRVQLFGTRGSSQRSLLFFRVSESYQSGRSVVLFVPEQFTLQAERDLLTFLHLPGLLRLDVVSPTKLKTLVRERAGSSGRAQLDEAGRAMAIHCALQRCGSKLQYYRRLSSLYGAVGRIDQTLSELKEENLTPDAMEALLPSVRNQAQRAKFQDLCHIWRETDRLLEDRFDDPTATWQDVCARLSESGLWQDVDLFVYGFDTIRPDLRDLILSAAEVCHSIQIFLSMVEASAPSGRVFRVQRASAEELSATLKEKGYTCSVQFFRPDPLALLQPIGFLEEYFYADHTPVFAGDPSPSISLYAAPHPTGEALKIVTVLRAWHDEGIPWSQMAIALPHDSHAADSLLAAMRRHEIPFFFSQPQSLDHHGVSRLLSASLSCVSQGYATESLAEIATSGFGTLSPEQGARLCAYVQTWGIDRGKWRHPFTRGEAAEEAERLRLRLLMPLERLHASLRGAVNASESIEAVFRFLQEENIYEQLNQRHRELMDAHRYAEAVIDRQVWAMLMNLLDQLYALLGDRKASLREVALLLTGALERSSLSALPAEEEGVAIGQIGHMLPGRTQAMIIPGLNDRGTNAGGAFLLSDRERQMLEQQEGRAIGLNRARLNMIVRSDFVRTMALPEKYLWVSFCLRDEAGTALLPAEPVGELRALFPLLQEQGGLEAEEVVFPPDTPNLALEGLGAKIRAMVSGQEATLSPPWQSALRLLFRQDSTSRLIQEMLSPLYSCLPRKTISASTAIHLFHGDRVSISRLECYAGCPFQHFLRYGIRPLLPRDFDFTAGDAGNFFHLALQQYLDQARQEKAWPFLAENRIEALMDDILQDLTLPWAEGPLREDALGRWQGDEYIRRVRHAASVLTRFAANSDFRVLGTEVEFGTSQGLPPLVLSLPDGVRVALQGKIDRLDLYSGPEGDYLRVLDLKSSEKKLDPARMDRGEQLQLMIYLKAALQSQKAARPAGALYFPVQDKEVDADSPDLAEASRLKAVQFSGVALADEEVLRAFDRDQSPFSLPKVFNQDGSIAKSASWALPAETLLHLMDAATGRAAELCHLIRSGAVHPAPSVSDQCSACSFCEFLSICPRRSEDERPLPKGLSYGDVGRVPLS